MKATSKRPKYVTKCSVPNLPICTSCARYSNGYSIDGCTTNNKNFIKYNDDMYICTAFKEKKKI